FLEGWALVFFGLLVLFDVMAHLAEEDKERSKRFNRFGLFFFAAAVLAEIIVYPYSRRNDALSSRQDARQKASIAELDNSAQQLKTQAKKAEAQIADANSRTKHAEAQIAEARTAEKRVEAELTAEQKLVADANKAAEDEKIARLQLEAQIAPRRLTAAQEKAIATACSQFAGTMVRVVSYSTDVEAAVLSKQIVAALLAAGMKVEDDTLSFMPVGSVSLGVFVHGKDTALVNAMTVILQADGKLAVGAPNSSNLYSAGGISSSFSADPDALTVLVGGKPIS